VLSTLPTRLVLPIVVFVYAIRAIVLLADIIAFAPDKSMIFADSTAATSAFVLSHLFAEGLVADTRNRWLTHD
jgi:hypothetical protein